MIAWAGSAAAAAARRVSATAGGTTVGSAATAVTANAQAMTPARNTEGTVRINVS